MTEVQAPSSDPVLACAATWQRARAEMLLTWAKSSEGSRFGTLGEEREFGAPTCAIQKLEGSAHMLGALEPSTVRGAREMLNVVLCMLAHREIDGEVSTVGSGPILQIVRNVRNALAWNGDARLGPESEAD